MHEALIALLQRYIRDCDAAWSCGSFGAIAEFARDPDEDAEISEDGLAIVTRRGGLRLNPATEIQPIAYELPSRHPDAWQHGLALAMRTDRALLAGREMLTEIGADEQSLHPAGRRGTLFDLGFGIGHADICIRTADPDAIAWLRGKLGCALLAPEGLPVLREIARLNPHRVFYSRLGRIEVYQPIPGPQDTSPSGPHTHVLPRLLVSRRTHAATIPIPDGWVPCMTLFPPNPISIGPDDAGQFDEVCHSAFQRLWECYVLPELVSLKAQATAALSAACKPPEGELSPPLDRFGRTIVRVAERQWRQLSRLDHPWSRN